MNEKPQNEETIRVIGFGRRLGASLIDGFMLLFGTFFLYLIVGMIIGVYAMFNPYEPLPAARMFIIIGLILSVVYYTGFWSNSGGSFGKNMLGIKVVGVDGQPLSIGKALLRYIGYLINGLIFSIGFLWIAFDAKRQGWHDKLAKTYVIYDGDEDMLTAGAVPVPVDHGQAGIWVVLWVVIALVAPPLLFSGLCLLGPSVVRTLGSMLGGG